MSYFSKIMVCVLCVSCLSGVAHAHRSTVEQIGDYMQVIVPAYALGMAMNEDGWDGVTQFAYSFATTEAAVYGLKYTVSEERPNEADNHSFPSGHTASAMSGASFIHARYGFKRAFLPYIMTGFTAYSRIDANKHWWWDTLAGAAIAGFMSYAFVDKYNNVAVSVGPQYVGAKVRF